jgi:DNA-binding transcriptional LysR family regulator
MDRLDAIASFIKVVETGSLSAAARALGLSLATVSRQIAALETGLGTRLLLRTTRRLSVTDGGRLYYERAKRALGELRETEIALGAQAAVPSGRLHVSAPTLIGRLHLAPLLPEFLALYPEVALDLTLIDRPVNLLEEGIDVALRIGQLEDSSLVARRLGAIRLVVCAAPDYLVRRGTPKRPEDLRAHDCLVFAALPGIAEWRFQSPEGKTTAVTVPARLRANALDVVVTAALAGAGVAQAPLWQIAEHVAAGRLRIVLAEHERPATPIHALFTHSHLMSAKVRAFADFLVARWAHRNFERLPASDTPAP